MKVDSFSHKLIWENVLNVLKECSENAMKVFHINQLESSDAQQGSRLWCPLIFLWVTRAYLFLSISLVFYNSQILTQKTQTSYICHVCIDSISVEGHPHTDWIIAHRISHRLSSVPAMHGFSQNSCPFLGSESFALLLVGEIFICFFIQEFIDLIFPDSYAI